MRRQGRRERQKDKKRIDEEKGAVKRKMNIWTSKKEGEDEEKGDKFRVWRGNSPENNGTQFEIYHEVAQQLSIISRFLH